MNAQTLLLELLLAGFFAVACIKCWRPAAPGGRAGFSNLLRFPDRWERLHRTRWQWFSMVLLMLVLRVQNELPILLESTAVLQFLLFMLLPGVDTRGSETRRRQNAASVENHLS